MSVKKISPGILLILVSFFFASCEFETDKVYERKTVRDVDPPEIKVEYLSLDKDTIYLFDERSFSFIFSNDYQRIVAARFLLDGVEQTVYYSGAGSFNLDYHNMSEGFHTLSVEIITNSGTGSIADILGAEGFLVTNSWVINVIKDFNIKLPAMIKNGCLYFSWMKYPAPDFNGYIIYRAKNSVENIEVGKTINSEFTDCSYVGEGGRYYVEVQKKDGTNIPWGFVELYPEPPVLKIISTGINDYSIIWNKCKYYNALENYQLSVSVKPFINFVKVMETENPQDTVWNIPSSYSFGEDIDVRLLINPRNSPIYNSDEYPGYIVSLFNIIVGFRFTSTGESAVHITQVAADEFIFAQGCDSLIRYSVSLKRALQKFSYNPSACSMCRFGSFKISPGGTFLTTRIDCNYDLICANSKDLYQNKRFKLTDLSGQGYVPGVPISDVGTGLINNFNSGFYVYDFNTASSIGYYYKENHGGIGFSISSDGKYIFLKDNLFNLVRFENSQFSIVWSRPDNSVPKHFEFHRTDPEKLVMWDGAVFSVRKCSDFSEFYNFTLTDKELLNIDFFSNEMLTYTQGHLYVRSLLDGSLIEDINVDLNLAINYLECILVNHSIICPTGVIYFIN